VAVSYLSGGRGRPGLFHTWPEFFLAAGIVLAIAFLVIVAVWFA
jgi:hypothetical protein